MFLNKIVNKVYEIEYGAVTGYTGNYDKSSGARGGHGSQPTMKKADGDAIQEKIEAIKLAAPVLEETAQIVYPVSMCIL